ncbi:MAG: hypothetical protein ABI759_08800 [Candidatus Solibacter sp.]
MAHAGILVSRTEQGLQFTDAVAITLNTKDKALSLGAQPKLSGPHNKLPQTPISGMLLRDTDAGVLARYAQGKPEYLLPQNLPKTAPDDAAAIWKTSKVTFKKTAQDKVGADMDFPSFVAFLPEGADELARLCMDDAALEFLGGKGKSFPAQIELMAAVVKAYNNNPAMAPLARFVEDSMRRRYNAFESGAAGPEALTEGLKFVELSQAVYPTNPEQDKLRKALTGRKEWLDRKAAILRAFAAGEQWDAFLLGDREFERFQQAFPDVAARHTTALRESLQLHQSAAIVRKDDSDFGGAYREYRLASARKPSDAALRDDALQVWTEYSRRVATERQSRRSRLQPGQQTAVDRYLDFADRYKAQKNLDEALKSVTDAEALLKKSLAPGAVVPETMKVLYKKADILGAQERTSEALATLEEYDLNAVGEERAPAETLRNSLLFTLNAPLRDMKGKVQAAFNEGSYNRAYQLALQGLRMKTDDADLLYSAGMSAVITRKPKEARELFARYLDVSNTLDAKTEERVQVRRLLTSIADTPAAEAGDPNWLSGKPLPKGVFYDPISLAFQPHIDRVDGSNKLKTTFEWDGEKLKSVTPVFEKNEHVTAEKKITVGYDDRGRQVVWATDGEEARPAAPADPDEAYKRATVLLPNNPHVDPLAIQKLTGKDITQGIAGNRFFNPYVWEKLYYFRFTYDDAGRVSRAQELTGPKGTPTDLVLELEWSGLQLMAIRGFQAKAKIYERTMQYQDGRLIGEEVQGSGKSAHLKYTYLGTRLQMAESPNDPTLDNRSRKVAFAANSATTLVK